MDSFLRPQWQPWQNARTALPESKPNIVVDTNASDAQVLDAFSKAADMAVMTGKLVFVKY
jgi:hypothetical protein